MGGLITPWITFIRMRFHPGTYLVMVGLFTAAHAVFAARTGAADTSDPAVAVGAAVGCVMFFLLLRIYDEIKDYDVDRVLHPERPLASGAITHRHLKRGIVFCIATVLAGFRLAGPAALAASVLAIGYSLLMYREFFVSDFLRPKLAAYAVTHTAVSILLSTTLVAAFAGRSILDFGARAWAFAVAAWCLFTVFEFGRKTFSSTEERDGVDSYSRLFGRTGAVVLNGVTALFGVGLLLYANGTAFGGLGRYLTLLLLTLAAAGAIYAKTDCSLAARAYRILTNAVIVAVYAGVALIPS